MVHLLGFSIHHLILTIDLRYRRHIRCCLRKVHRFPNRQYSTMTCRHRADWQRSHVRRGKQEFLINLSTIRWRHWWLSAADENGSFWQPQLLLVLLPSDPLRLLLLLDQTHLIPIHFLKHKTSSKTWIIWVNSRKNRRYNLPIRRRFIGNSHRFSYGNACACSSSSRLRSSSFWLPLSSNLRCAYALRCFCHDKTIDNNQNYFT